MSYSELIRELKLEDKIIAATRVSCESGQETTVSHHCIFKAFERVLTGETLILKQGSCGCKGFDTNAGFLDEMPQIPGGYELFLSYGAGEGFRAGERLKCNPAVAASYFEKLPKQVMDGFDAIQLAPYQEGMNPDLVISFVTLDQLAAMAFLYDFRNADYDNIIAPTLAGCASLFRVPFSERKRDHARAVIGNIDLVSRPHMEETLVTFTVSSEAFQTMLEDTKDCFFHSPIWSSLRHRIHKGGL